VKENVSKASAKHTGVGDGGGGVCEQSKQEQIERLWTSLEKVDLLDPCYQPVTSNSAP